MWKSLLRLFIAIVIILSVMIILVGFLSTTLFIRLLDFENYLSATRILWHGQNPYGTVEFFSPPWFAILILPLTQLPIEISTSVWLLLLVLCTVGSVGLSLRWLGNVPKAEALLFIILVPTLMPGALYSYITGQISPVVNMMALLVAYNIASFSTSLWIPILAILVVTLKPHIVALPIGLCMMELVRQRHWRAIVGIIGSLVILFVLAFAILPDWLSSMLNALVQGKYRGGPGLISPGYVGLRELGTPSWAFLPQIAYVLFRWWRDGLNAHLFALALVTNLLVLPYSRSYDFVVFILPLLVLAKFESWRNWPGFALAITCVFVLPWTSLSVITPVLLAIALLLKCD